MRFRIPVENPSEDATHLQISVSYEKGGTNVWHGNQDARGIYLAAMPVTITPEGFMQCVIGRGRRRLVEPAARLNTKRVLVIDAQAQSEVDAKAGVLWEFVQRVAAEYKLVLTDSLVVG